MGEKMTSKSDKRGKGMSVGNRKGDEQQDANV